MHRLSLRQRVALQLVVVLSLVLAVDNVRVPAGAEATSRGRRETPTTTTPPTTAAPATTTTVDQGRGNNGQNPSDIDGRGNEEHGNCGGGNGTESAPVGNSGVECPNAGSAASTSTSVIATTTSVSVTTVPDTTSSVPQTTIPRTTVPATGTPATTAPQTTAPETTTPSTTTPVVVVPSPALPETSVPGEIEPVANGSTNGSTPVAEQPVVTVVLSPTLVTSTPDTRTPTTQPPVTLEDGTAELRIGGESTSPYLVSATPPANLSERIELDLTLASRVSQQAIDLGYVSVRLDATDSAGNPVEEFSRPVQVRLQRLPGDGVVAMSSDEFEWQSIARLAAPYLANGQTAGYFVDADGSVVVLTTKTGLVGIRKQRSALAIDDLWAEMTPGSATKLSVTGQIGDDRVILTVSGSGSACLVSNTGVVRAVSGGVCKISAVQGGGSMYMSASAPVATTSVSFIDKLQETVIRYRTSIAMVLLVIFLVAFLLWQMGQTVVDVRRALHTDPEAL